MVEADGYSSGPQLLHTLDSVPLSWEKFGSLLVMMCLDVQTYDYVCDMITSTNLIYMKQSTNDHTSKVKKLKGTEVGVLYHRCVYLLLILD